MNQFLTKRTFGMPRWAFLSLLAGGVILGLYLRARQKEKQAVAGDSYPTETGGSLADSTDPGLAGVGVVSPPGGVYPVTTPTLPEGFTDVVASLADLATNQGQALAEMPNAVNNQQPPVVNVTVPTTGGGPPRAPKKTVPSSGKVNVNKSNPRYGETYKTVPAKGGVYHVYPNGKRVFVKH